MVLGKKGGLRSAVKQAGRQATKYAFTITSTSTSRKSLHYWDVGKKWTNNTTA